MNLCLSIVCLKAPRIIEKIGVTKRGAISLAFVNLLTWVPLVIVFILAKFKIAPVWIAAMWLINIMPGMLLSFQKDNWLSDIIPNKTQGRYLGQRLAIKSSFYLVAFFLFGYFMDAMGNNNLVSFGLVFLVATVMTFIYFYIYTHMYDPEKNNTGVVKEAKPEVKFGLMDFVNEVKKRKLDKFLIFSSLINISIGLSAPFYAVYMLQEQSFSYLNYTIIISVEFMARVISGPFWGKFADKEGNIKVLKIVSRIVPALPICWLFSTNIGYLAFVQVLSGVCWGAFDLSTQSYLYKVAPAAKKLRYIVYTRSLMLFSVAIGGLAGSLLIKDIFEIFGSKLLTIFMFSGFMRALIVMFLIPRLIDLAVNYGVPDNPKINLALVKKATISTKGLFYHLPGPAVVPANVIENKIHTRNMAMEQRLAEAYAARRQLMALTEAVKNGRPRNWALEAANMAQSADGETGLQMPAFDTINHRARLIREKHEILKKETKIPAVISPVRKPWFGDIEIWANYRLKAAVAMTSGNNLDGGKTASHSGLFYNDSGWAHYKEESLKEVLREKEASKAAATKRSVFIESSYPWRNTY